jgi:hypothetical protein
LAERPRFFAVDCEPPSAPGLDVSVRVNVYFHVPYDLCVFVACRSVGDER